MKDIFNSSDNLINVINAFLNKTDACIFFSDIETREVVYINEKMRKEFGYYIGDFSTCDKVLNCMQECVCDNCSVESMESSLVVKFVYNGNKNQYYKYVESFSEIEKGVMLRMHHITQIIHFGENKKTVNDYGADFLSQMSHELLTPINAIKNMAHIAESSEDITKIKSCVSSIFSATAQLTEMLNDILDVSRMKIRQINLVNLPFELDKTLARVCEAAAQKNGEDDRKIEFHIEENVPVKLRGDEFRLAQVIANLSKSILKFASNESEIKINVKAMGQVTDKATLRFRVFDENDNKNNRAYLFEIFEQLSDGEHKNYGEMNPSLVICKKIIESMSGNIWLEDIEEGVSSLNFVIHMNVFKYDESSELPAVSSEIQQSESKQTEIKEQKHNSHGINKGREYKKYLPYIDVKGGVSHVGGNEKLFISMLKNFKDGNVFSDLKKSVEEENLLKIRHNYGILKSVSRNLSLIKLHKVLTLNENQLKIKPEQKNIIHIVQIVEEIIKETNQKINQILAESY